MTRSTLVRPLLGLALALGCTALLARRPASTPAVKGPARPLRFEPNQGQFDEPIRFLSRGAGYGLYLTRAGATLALARPGAAPAVVTMHVAGGREVDPVGTERLAGESHYLGDRRATGVPGYAGVRYPQVRPGVDLVFYGNGRQLEYDLVVAPGADRRALRVAFDGVERTALDADGAVVLSLKGGGELRKAAPRAYQEEAGERVPVLAQYRLETDGTLGFELGAHDRQRPLVIDPVLVFSTYLGGTNADGTEAMTVDRSGQIYVAGYTLSTNFPSAAPAQANNGGNYDAYVTKLDASGGGLVYSTYLGGSAEDRASAVAADGDGNAYVTGFTLSSNFPTKGALQASNAGAHDVFVAKLSPTGALVYATYLGGADTDAAYGIAVDAGGAAYVAGYTFSAGFPTAAPIRATRSGSTDAFVSKLNAAGTALVYSTFLGGGGDEVANGIAVDGVGSAYLVGWTASTDFPTVTPIKATLSGASDVFVARLTSAGTALSYSTYLGGSGADVGQAIAVDQAFSAYVTGYTTSTNFPTVNPAQAAFAGTQDGFVSKLSPAGNALAYSTYLGGSFLERANAIAVDPDGQAAVVGYTESFDFPTATPFQRTHGGGFDDAFLTSLAASGSALVYSTYLGGNDDDNAHGVAALSSGLYVAGTTRSSNFPVFKARQAANLGGPWDAFLLRVGKPPSLVPAGRPATSLLLAGLLLGLCLALLPSRRSRA